MLRFSNQQSKVSQYDCIPDALKLSSIRQYACPEYVRNRCNGLINFHLDLPGRLLKGALCERCLRTTSADSAADNKYTCTEYCFDERWVVLMLYLDDSFTVWLTAAFHNVNVVSHICKVPFTPAVRGLYKRRCTVFTPSTNADGERNVCTDEVVVLFASVESSLSCYVTVSHDKRPRSQVML